MSFYFPNVDPTFIFKRNGTNEDPYIFRHETYMINNSIITLLEIPNPVNKVIVKKLDGTTLTEVNADSLQANQYRVDYSTGVVYFHESLERFTVTCDFYGMGMISFPSSRVWVDTNDGSSIKTMQQMINDLDNVKTNWLAAVTSFASIATTYPNPKLGDTVQTTDDSRIYRFNGSAWVNTQQYSENAITNFQNRLDGLSKVSNQYEWTTTVGQLIYTLPPNSNLNDKWLEVSVGGAILPSSLIRIDSTTQFTLLVSSTEIPEGIKVVATWVEPFIPATIGHKGTHEKGGFDEIDVTKLKNYQENITEPLAIYASDISDLKKKTDWVDVSKYGYDLNAVKTAIATLKDGDVLYFPNAVAPYQILGEPISISVPNITIRGNGLLQMEYGFRPTESGFTIDGVRMEATRYHTESRAIKVDIPPTGKFIRNFVVRNCNFKNFFYAADFRGGSYDVTGNEAGEGFPIRDVVIENCYSETFTDKNTGHFNCTQVENVSYIGNRTYGGTTATSYNVIKGNGFITYLDNYDENNVYGSCEIENISGKAVISGNTFKKGIWVDDSYSVVIDGNFVDDVIKVTVGSNVGNADNIIISNNVVKNIRVEQYGFYEGGSANNIFITSNILNATSGVSYGIWVDGKYTGFVLVDNNLISGNYSSGKVGIVRGTAWVSSTAYIHPIKNPDGTIVQQGSIVNANGNTYLCVSSGTSGTIAPSHTSGTATDGTVTWKYINKTCDVFLKQNIANGSLVISGSGGKVTSLDNIGFTITSGNVDDGDTCSSLPTPSANMRGKQILLRKGTGVADEYYVCRKQADDTYAWIKVI